MPGPYSITISPVGFHARPGEYVIMTVTDSGTKPITVNSLPSILTGTTGKCKLNAAPREMTVSPARFTLKPGESRRATVTINKNASPHLAIVFYATEKTRKNIKVNAGAAAQVTTKGTILQCNPAAAITHKGGIPAAYIMAGGIGTLMICLAICAVIVRRNHGKHRESHSAARQYT